jgi:hypothetical protein
MNAVFGQTTVIDYGYTTWEKIWPLAMILVVIPFIIVMARRQAAYNRRGGYSGRAEDCILWGIIWCLVAVLLAFAVPALNRNGRVTGFELDREAAALQAQAESNGYEAIDVYAQDDTFTVSANGCRLTAGYTQTGDNTFDTFVTYRQYRSSPVNEFHFETLEDLTDGPAPECAAEADG